VAEPQEKNENETCPFFQMVKSCDTTCHVKLLCAQKFEAKQPDFSSAFEGAAPTADDPAPEPK
jgi:hypothetical protein